MPLRLQGKILYSITLSYLLIGMFDIPHKKNNEK